MAASIPVRPKHCNYVNKVLVSVPFVYLIFFLITKGMDSLRKGNPRRAENLHGLRPHRSKPCSARCPRLTTPWVSEDDATCTLVCAPHKKCTSKNNNKMCQQSLDFFNCQSYYSIFTAHFS